MKRKLLYGLITLILTSCGVDHTDFSGDWIDKKNEQDRLIIKKNGDNYIVQNGDKKYPAQIKDGLLEISSELPIKATIDDNDYLIVGGEEYVRLENSIKYKLVGLWEFEKGNYSYQEKRIFGNHLKIEMNEKGNLTLNCGDINDGSFSKDNYSGFDKISYSNGAIKGRCFRASSDTGLMDFTKFELKFNDDYLNYSEESGNIRLTKK